MKLTELKPQFLARVSDGHRRYVDTIGEAQGVMFLCPRCYRANAEAGTHYVMVWFRGRGVPDTEVPGPGRWGASGGGYADLTLSPSIQLLGGGCDWHGFVQNGETT